MTKIPFLFHSPTPSYFRDNGLFKNPLNKAFVDWCFERCSPEKRTVYHDNQKIILEPYQFIFGRLTCSQETGLTENQVRTQAKRWEILGLLKKTTNRITNRFTVYTWVLTSFTKNNHQQNNHPTTNRPPTDHHNQEDKKTRSKESHHPYPSSSSDGLDDLSSKNENETNNLIEVIPKPKIFMTQSDLDACIAIKGDLQKVQFAVEYIMRSRGRKHKIMNWPNTLAKWEIKNDIKPRIVENEDFTKRLEKYYENYPTWRCKAHIHTKKDCKGILFFAVTGNCEPFFVAYADLDFKLKVNKFIQEKKIQKGRFENNTVLQ